MAKFRFVCGLSRFILRVIFKRVIAKYSCLRHVLRIKRFHPFTELIHDLRLE